MSSLYDGVITTPACEDYAAVGVACEGGADVAPSGMKVTAGAGPVSLSVSHKIESLQIESLARRTLKAHP